MVQVRVLGVALDAAGQHIILLKPLGEEPSVGRVLPIWIGEQEATSILIALGGDHAPRPLTHDLMKMAMLAGRFLGWRFAVQPCGSRLGVGSPGWGHARARTRERASR